MKVQAKPVELPEIIREQASYVTNSGVDVQVDTRLGTVAMVHEGETVFFLEGYQAGGFIDSARSLYYRTKEITLNEAYTATAKPYVESLELGPSAGPK